MKKKSIVSALMRQNRALREMVKNLLGGACNRCGSKRYLKIHHIDRNPNNNAASNLELLCASCHNKEHKLIERAGEKAFCDEAYSAILTELEVYKAGHIRRDTLRKLIKKVGVKAEDKITYYIRLLVLNKAITKVIKTKKGFVEVEQSKKTGRGNTVWYRIDIPRVKPYKREELRLIKNRFKF